MLSGKESALALLLAAGLAGCGRDETRVYQATKDPATPGAAPSSKGPPWKVPAGWDEKPASGGMRVASYGVTAADGRTADISVTALAGDAGGVLENVNRWRGQVGLGPVTSDQLAPQTVKIGDQDGALYELVAEKPLPNEKFKSRTLAALLPAGDMTVFFKITGEDALVAENKIKFLEFLKSVNTVGNRPEGVTASTAPLPAPTLAPSGAPPKLAGPVAPRPDTGAPKWDVPAGWKAAAGNPMRLATFEVPNAGGTAGDFSVTALGPAAGGTLSNVNRWRGQLGLTPISESDVASTTTSLDLAGGEKATLVDLKSTDGRRILAAIIARADRTWFYKLTGDDALLGREKDHFTQFVKSVKY